jgi:translation initiation factor 2 gamma subunit (eIF-2gamma)
MKSIIIGTAGHIDHGKTALVKALTQIRWLRHAGLL